MVAGVLIDEPLHPCREADSRDRDPALRDPHPFRILGDGQRREEAVEVGQRLPHPHHDDVADPLRGREEAGKTQKLFEDLAGSEIADDAVYAAGAEHAPHRTADLRADADRAPLAVAEHDAFDPLPIVELQEQFLGAVLRLRVGGDGRRPERELGLERLAKGLGEIGHVGKRRRPASIQPAPHRLRPPGGLAEFGEARQEGGVRVEEVVLHGRERAAGDPLSGGWSGWSFGAGIFGGERPRRAAERRATGRSSGAATDDGVEFGRILSALHHNSRRRPGFRHERTPLRGTHPVGL